MKKTNAERLEIVVAQVTSLRDNSLDAAEHDAWQLVLEAAITASKAGQDAYARRVAQQVGKGMAHAVLSPTRARTRG